MFDYWRKLKLFFFYKKIINQNVWLLQKEKVSPLLMDFADMDLAMAGLPPNKMGLESPPNNAMTSSFVGSKLWDKSIIYDPDFAVS